MATSLLMAGCGGGGGDGPRVIATAQSISLASAPPVMAGQTLMLAATASSGLALRFASATPTQCSVDPVSGQMSALQTGTCQVLANQAGNAAFAPAPQAVLNITVTINPVNTLSFGPAPALAMLGVATVQAVASSGLPVAYSSLTPVVCTVDATSGVVTDLAAGSCIVAADQPGSINFAPATQATQTLVVAPPPPVPTVPAAPAGVSATLGNNASTVQISLASVDSGGSAVIGYVVESVPAGLTVNAASSPVTVNCPGGCAGLSFTLRAVNAVGTGTASAPAEVLTIFDVVTVFREPDTQPRDTVFSGSFTLNSTTGAITGLSGRLTESMTGNAVGAAPFYDMTQIALNFQLVSWVDAALGGRFVASFAKNTLSTFTTLGGGDGWSPQAGVDNGGVYAGFPAPHAGTIQNSSVLIFVPDDPFSTLTPSQINKLAYADCASGGMMGAVCMTATSVAGYGAVGTMSGFPVSQTITRR